MTNPFGAAASFDASGRVVPMRRDHYGLKIIDPVRWSGKSLPTRRWIVDGLIPMGAVTMLGGDGGLGKSLLTMQLLTAAAARQGWLGMGVMPCKAFGVYCEDETDELHRRMADIVGAYGLGFDDLENLQMVSRVGMPNELWQVDKYGKPNGESEFYSQILNEAKAFGAQLIVLDGLHDLFPGNENSRPEARRFINMLRRIALETDGAVVLCAHPSLSGLNSGSGTAGSTAWNNAVRSRLYLTKPKEEDDTDRDARVLKSMKSNYGKTGDEIRIRWKEGVFVTDAGMGGSVVDHLSRQKAFLECLRAAKEQGRYASDAKNSPRFAPKLLASFPAAKGIGQRSLERAMNELFASGKIQVASVSGADRHPISAIVEVVS